MVEAKVERFIQPAFDEGEFYSAELGVVKNSWRRIVATGWPEIGKDEWPEAFGELERSVKRQMEAELEAREVYFQDGDESPRIHGKVFHLNDAVLWRRLHELIEGMIATKPLKRPIRVCDVGGGLGGLMAKTSFAFEPGLVECSMTTLVDFKPQEEVRKLGISRVESMAIELPLDSFFASSDVIVAQNSVFYWSAYPELATLNLWKMLDKGGVVLATIPSASGSLLPVGFNTEKYLRESALFDFEQLSARFSSLNYPRDIDVAVKLTRVDG
jgi:SAM-dependent methyltransferase